MNLFLIRLPYFSGCCFSLYLISIFESDPISNNENLIPNIQSLPNQPLYVGNLQI
jgi:hypothetical protein